MIKNVDDLVPDKRKQNQGRHNKNLGQTNEEYFASNDSAGGRNEKL